MGAKLNTISNLELLNIRLPLEVEIWINAIAGHYRDKNPRLTAPFKFTGIDGVLPKCSQLFIKEALWNHEFNNIQPFGLKLNHRV